jgi:hypothetical protein
MTAVMPYVFEQGSKSLAAVSHCCGCGCELLLRSVADHEYACMHDLMMHLGAEPQARYSNVHDVSDI